MRALLKEIAQNPLAMFYAVLVHVALAAVLFFSLGWPHNPQPIAAKVNVVQAVAVNEKQILAELEKLKKAESLEKKKAEARLKKDEAHKRKLERQAREAKKKRQAEEKRLAKLKKQREKEASLKKDADKKRKAEDKKRKAEDKKRKAEQLKEQEKLERLKAEQVVLEKKRLAEETRLAELEVKRQQEKAAELKRAEDARKRREQEAAMRAEIAAEQVLIDAENQRRLDLLRGQYIAAITDKVERNWLKPPSVRAGLSCRVLVKQIPGGEVVDVQVSQCTGDESFRRSVEIAVKKSSPLPTPKDPRLFDREIIFNFNPQ